MEKKNMGRKLLDLYGKVGVYFLLLVVIVIFSMLSNVFLSVNNIKNIGKQVSMIGICAVGISAVMLTGGIDISCGSIMALVSVVGAWVMTNLGWNMWAAILVCLILGAALGCWNGVVITYFKLPPMIATLAMQTIARGIGFIITSGTPIYGLPEEIKSISQGEVFGLPVSILIMFLVYALGYWFLEKTYIGRRIYALGGNAEAARLSGINVDRIMILVYTISSLMSAVAGVVMLSRINSGQPNTAQAYEMNVIPAAVLGGISLNGGEGKILNVIAGVLIMGCLSTGMTIIGLNEYWQYIVKGVVLTITVAIDNAQKGKLKKA